LLAGETLAAERDFGMLSAGEGQAEVMKPMGESLAGDRHGKVAMSVRSARP
jgi:hypothetical protein